MVSGHGTHGTPDASDPLPTRSMGERHATRIRHGNNVQCKGGGQLRQPLNMSTVVHSALARLGKRCSDEQHSSPRAHRPVASRVSLAQDRNHVLESFPERPTIPR